MRETLSDKGFFFFNDTATTEIYTLSLHDALPISADGPPRRHRRERQARRLRLHGARPAGYRARPDARSEEHTSELQSQSNLVCRLLLEKKKHSEIGAPAASDGVAAAPTSPH